MEILTYIILIILGLLVLRGLYWAVCLLLSGLSTAVSNGRWDREQRINEIQYARDAQDQHLNRFVSLARGCFRSPGSHRIAEMEAELGQIRAAEHSIRAMGARSGARSRIESCEQTLQTIRDIQARAQAVPASFMLQPVATAYGTAIPTYWNYINSLKKADVDRAVAQTEQTLRQGELQDIGRIEPCALLNYIWFYALQKPFDVASFERAERIFRSYTNLIHPEETVAYDYALKSMGGEKVLLDRVRERLKTANDPWQLSVFASGYMWMGAYQAETMILQHMLNEKLRMPSVLQERLHQLSNGGGNAPVGYQVASYGSRLYYDVSSLTWKDEEYTGLFENFAFRNERLRYALAVRDEDKSLFVPGAFALPQTDSIRKHLQTAFQAEYGKTVTLTQVQATAMSGSGTENIDGILIRSGDCGQMGILLVVVQIGKMLNLKFYTLYLPGNDAPRLQKQQALSLRNGLSPSTVQWERSLKNSALAAIQQLLNSGAADGRPSHRDSAKDELVF